MTTTRETINQMTIQNTLSNKNLRPAPGGKKTISRALAGIGASFFLLSNAANAAPTLTEFTLNTGIAGVTTGTFATGNGNLVALGGLVGTGNTYNYAAQLFTPSATGSYTFGMSSAPVDTVLILYTGSYDPANPSTNAVALNDDSDGLGAGGVVMGTCGASAGLCPRMTETLTGSTDYYVVITTFASGAPVTLPLGFYVFGDPVGVGGAPPPASLSVLGSSTTMANSPAFGGARIIDNTPALLALFTGAGLTGDTQISNAASQTLPLLTGGSQIASQNALSGINRVIQARISANRGMSSGDVFSGDKNFWIKPFGSRAKQDTTDGVAGYKAETYGLAGGFDGTVGSATRLGLAFAYASSNIDSNSSVARQSADVNVYQLVGYGSYSLDERTELNFQIDAGRNSNDGKRTIAFTNTVAKSDYNSTSAHIGAGLGRTYAISQQTSLIPSVRADYTWVRDDSYREKGAGLLNLNVNERSTRSFVIGADGKVSHQMNDRTTLTANIGVGYDTLNERSSITPAFAGAPGAAFVTHGIKPSPWIGQAGFGLVHQASNGMEISGRYDAEHRTGFLNHTASLKVRWAF
jgi:outer membrane autotransporter protein